MTDESILDDLKAAFQSGCDYLAIKSRRQDLGLRKCQRGWNSVTYVLTST